jgi:hypothetical protein
MFCPKLRDVLKQLQTRPNSQSRKSLVDPLHDLDAALRTDANSAPAADEDLLGLCVHNEGQSKASRRFM